MGGGSSLLNEEQQKIVASSMKQQYDYCKALGMCEELINDTMTTEYHSNIKKLYPDYVIPDFTKHAPAKYAQVAAENANKKPSVSAKESKSNSRRGSWDKAPAPLVRRNSDDNMQKRYMVPTLASAGPPKEGSSSQSKRGRRN